MNKRRIRGKKQILNQRAGEISVASIQENGVNNISRGVSAKPSPSDWLKLGMPLLRELICGQWKPSLFLGLTLATM
jgi:hypothetical protein